jgi:hypothetical protein
MPARIVAKAKGGSNRVSNLCIACEPCNQAKGSKDLEQFLDKKPDVLKKIQAQCQAPLHDAAAVNTTRWTLLERLKGFSRPIECGSGGCTKYNRLTRGLPKTHWLDAACVGQRTPACLHIEQVVPWRIEAKGHGNRQMGYANNTVSLFVTGSD